MDAMQIRDRHSSEEALVKLYMELTGASEGTARNVYAVICPEQSDEESDKSSLNRFVRSVPTVSKGETAAHALTGNLRV
jgi:hypothetical protein